jgi:SNF family Na+-dependent transporter
VLGFTVGYGSFWRFPYLVYENGGGVFLIPYVLALVVFGVPLLYLETAIGQMHQQTIPCIYEKINKGLKMFGYFVIFIAFNISIYYNLLLTYSYRFILTAFVDPLPFMNEQPTDNTYFNEVVLHRSSSID